MRKLIEDIYAMFLDTEGCVRTENPLENELGEKETAIRKLLSGKAKEVFDAYDNARDALELSIASDDFVNGFRMGARLMLEILYDDSGKAQKGSNDT